MTSPDLPQYSFKAHWTDDKRIGVVACVTRPDGGVHLLQTIIDPPSEQEQRQWVGLTNEEIENAISDGFARGLDDGNVSNREVIHYVRVIEAALKEKNYD